MDISTIRHLTGTAVEARHMLNQVADALLKCAKQAGGYTEISLSADADGLYGNYTAGMKLDDPFKVVKNQATRLVLSYLMATELHILFTIQNDPCRDPLECKFLLHVAIGYQAFPGAKAYKHSALSEFANYAFPYGAQLEHHHNAHLKLTAMLQKIEQEAKQRAIRGYADYAFIPTRLYEEIEPQGLLKNFAPKEIEPSSIISRLEMKIRDAGFRLETTKVNETNETSYLISW